MDLDTSSEETQRLTDSDGQRDDGTPDIIVLASLPAWQQPGYKAFHYAKAGFWLGSLAGCTSLIVNVIGSVLWPAISGEAQHPLRIIQVYLTFPLGESALQLNSGVLLALGCLLFLGIGMLYGMLFELMISFFLPRAGMLARLVSCSVLALAVWMLN